LGVDSTERRRLPSTRAHRRLDGSQVDAAKCRALRCRPRHRRRRWRL